MAALTADRIRGVWATVLLDVAADGTPRLDCIAEQVAVLARAGVDGIYCNGTATEFHCQDETLFARVARATAEAARAHALPFQIGASHPLPLPALDRVRLAATLGPGAIQVTLPDWTPLRETEALRFLTRAAEVAGEVPLVLYNPPHAKTVLPPEALLRLSRALPSLVGLKCAGGDADWYRAMRPVLDRLSVFIPGHFYASGTAQGAHGAYSNMACLNPDAAVRWARQCRDDPAGAQAQERAIAAFMAEAIAPIIAEGHFGHACDKAMATAGGWAQITPRMLWPQDAVADAAVERIRAVAERVLPGFVAVQ